MRIKATVNHQSLFEGERAQANFLARQFAGKPFTTVDQLEADVLLVCMRKQLPFTGTKRLGKEVHVLSGNRRVVEFAPKEGTPAAFEEATTTA